MAPTSILFYKDVGHSQEGAQEVVSLFGDKGVFDGPKPVRLLQRLITLANLKDDSIVLDFFSGSATTAHALMKTNLEKGTDRKFILVQLPEKVSDKKRIRVTVLSAKSARNASAEQGRRFWRSWRPRKPRMDCLTKSPNRHASMWVSVS